MRLTPRQRLIGDMIRNTGEFMIYNGTETLWLLWTRQLDGLAASFSR